MILVQAFELEKIHGGLFFWEYFEVLRLLASAFIRCGFVNIFYLWLSYLKTLLVLVAVRTQLDALLLQQWRMLKMRHRDLVFLN